MRKAFAERFPDPAAVFHRNNAVHKLDQSVVVRGRPCALRLRPYWTGGESAGRCAVI